MINMEFTFDEWREYQVRKCMNPKVLAFLTVNPKYISRKDNKPCPGTWDKVSKMMYAVMDDNLRYEVIVEMLGKEIGEMFELIIRPLFVNVTDIVNAKPSKRAMSIYEKYDAIYSVNQYLRDYTKSPNKVAVETFESWVDNYLSFIEQNMEDEFIIMALRDAIMIHNIKLSSSIPAFKRIYERFSNLLINA